MDNFRDVYLEHALKRWVRAHQPPKGLRAQICQRVGLEARREQADILQAFILPSNQVFGWTFAYSLFGTVRNCDTALAGVSVQI